MLSACTAGTVGVNTDVIRVNLYVNVFLDVRHDIAGHKGGLALSRSVKGRYADQTVHTVFRAQVTVGIFPVNLHCNRLDTGFIPVQEIQYLCLESLFLCPAAVHAVKHAAPVTGLRAACPRVQAQYGIVAVIFTGQK